METQGVAPTIPSENEIATSSIYLNEFETNPAEENFPLDFNDQPAFMTSGKNRHQFTSIINNMFQMIRLPSIQKKLWAFWGTIFLPNRNIFL